MLITRKSRISGKVHTQEMDVTPEQIARFESGVFVQDAFPHLNADDREFMLSGITAKEWKDTFGTED